jgi:hypothetical protein
LANIEGISCFWAYLLIGFGNQWDSKMAAMEFVGVAGVCGTLANCAFLPHIRTNSEGRRATG